MTSAKIGEFTHDIRSSCINPPQSHVQDGLELPVLHRSRRQLADFLFDFFADIATVGYGLGGILVAVSVVEVLAF